MSTLCSSFEDKFLCSFWQGLCFGDKPWGESVTWQLSRTVLDSCCKEPSLPRPVFLGAAGWRETGSCDCGGKSSDSTDRRFPFSFFVELFSVRFLLRHPRFVRRRLLSSLLNRDRPYLDNWSCEARTDLKRSKSFLNVTTQVLFRIISIYLSIWS